MKAVGFDTPTASMKAQNSTPSTRAQMKETTPWSTLGGAHGEILHGERS